MSCIQNLRRSWLNCHIRFWIQLWDWDSQNNSNWSSHISRNANSRAINTGPFNFGDNYHSTIKSNHRLNSQIFTWFSLNLPGLKIHPGLDPSHCSSCQTAQAGGVHGDSAGSPKFAPIGRERGKGLWRLRCRLRCVREVVCHGWARRERCVFGGDVTPISWFVEMEHL